MTPSRATLILGLLLITVSLGLGVVRRDTLQSLPNGLLVPSLVVTGETEFDSGTNLGTGTVTGTEILDGTVTAADIATDGVGTAEIAADAVAASEIAAGAVATSELATGAVATVDMGPALIDSIIFCGQLVNNSTTYLGPSAAAYLGSGADTSAGGAVCDALDSTTETTADNPIATTFGAFKVLGMYCRVTSDPASDVVFTARSAAAGLTPALTCTVAGTGSSQHCVAATSTTTDIAANAAVAIQVVTLEDLSTQDGWCKWIISMS